IGVKAGHKLTLIVSQHRTVLFFHSDLTAWTLAVVTQPHTHTHTHTPTHTHTHTHTHTLTPCKVNGRGDGSVKGHTVRQTEGDISHTHTHTFTNRKWERLQGSDTHTL